MKLIVLYPVNDICRRTIAILYEYNMLHRELNPVYRNDDISINNDEMSILLQLIEGYTICPLPAENRTYIEPIDLELETVLFETQGMGLPIHKF